MRRRSRPRVVWLPGTNANSVGIGGGNTDNHVQTFIVGIPGPVAIGDTSVGEIPLVIDSQDDVLDPVTSLSDIENSGYRLRRIVGKIWIRPLTSTLDDPGALIVTAGLIVRRSNPVDGVSYAFTTGDATLVNPQFIHNDGDPWIWRRSWFLDWTSPTIGGFLAGQGTNYGTYAGGNSDAAHVDQKTARIVSSEERLFLDVSILAPFTSVAAQDVQVFSDLRVLASMRSSSGNRNNASR